MIDLNAERKRRAGLADTGRCACGRYRLFCNGPTGCLDQADTSEREKLRAAYEHVMATDLGPQHLLLADEVALGLHDQPHP